MKGLDFLRSGRYICGMLYSRIIIVLLLTAGSLCARVLHVPSEYSTVQAGLDSVRSGDTVLVALGTYSESLQAPSLPFVLKGDVVEDTGDYPRPVIDPALLPGSDTMRCLTLLPGSDPLIQDIRFRNGPEMYPHGGFIGGITASCARIRFDHCVFDSLFYGLYFLQPCSLSLRNCCFLTVHYSMAGVYSPYVYAKGCLFTGQGTAVRASGAWLEECQFGPNDDGPLCEVYGDVHIAGCQFGPWPEGMFSWSAPLTLYGPDGEVEHNVFTRLGLGAEFITVTAACNDTATFAICHNLFTNSAACPPSGSTGIAIVRQPGHDGGCGVAVDSNEFKENSNSQICRGVFLGTDGEIIGNRFKHLGRDTSYQDVLPVWAVIVLAGTRTAQVHSNRFDSTGIVFWDYRESPYDTADLRGNWWGSASGPYHDWFNPQGQGDTVIGNYLWLDPWCTDTACTPLASADERPDIKPTRYALMTYPNPFNSTTFLHLEVPSAEIVRVELFDLLGRRVSELWSGAVADRQDVALDGSALSSGIYFVRVTNPIWNRPLVSTKIVLLK